MTRLPRYLGTAEREVFHTLLRRPGREWRSGQRPLYETGVFTEELLQRLALREMVEVVVDDNGTVYRAVPMLLPQR